MSDTSKASEVLKDVYDGRVFAGGWGEVETFKEILRTDLFMPVVYAEKRTTASHNKKVTAHLFHICRICLIFFRMNLFFQRQKL